MNWDNRVTKLLKIKYPFIQAPMLGFSTPEMVAAASNSGAMGSLPLGLMSKQNASEAITVTKKLTSSPFAVNLFVYPETEVKNDALCQTLRSYYARYNLPFPSLPKGVPYRSYQEIVETLIEEKPAAVSFTFGIPSYDIVDKLKANGIILIGVATSTDEAKKIQDSGLDLVVAQGIEAGGHRGSFLPGDLPQVGLISLVPQILDSVQVPVVAAGGLSQGRSIAAALILGADGVQVGSAFLRSKESSASNVHKQMIAALQDTGTILTSKWTGRYARMIPNDFIKLLPDEEILPYPFQNYMSAPLRQFGKEYNLSQIQTLYAGQSAGYAKDDSTTEIIHELIADTEYALHNSPFML